MGTEWYHIEIITAEAALYTKTTTKMQTTVLIIFLKLNLIYGMLQQFLKASSKLVLIIDIFKLKVDTFSIIRVASLGAYAALITATIS